MATIPNTMPGSNNPSQKGGMTSKNMRILQNVALARSRANMAGKFRSPLDLQDISLLRSQIEKQLAIADAQLNAVVQLKVDALKRSVDLMEEGTVKLSQFQKGIVKINEKIDSTNTEISKFPTLKRIHNIRANLQKVIEQIEYFGDVPQKNKLRSQILKTDINQLRQVFLESIESDSFRSILLQEIRDDEFELRIAVESYLRSVPVLATEIVQRIVRFFEGNSDLLSPVGNSDAGAMVVERDFIDHAMLSAADLIVNVEVAEMHQEYYNRRKKQFADIVNSATASEKNSLGTKKTVDVTLENYNVFPKIVSVMRKAMEKRIVSTFQRQSERAAATKTSQVDGLVEAGSDLIKLLVDIINEVDPCFPPHYEIVPTFFDLFVHQLTPRIDEICQHVQSISVVEIFNLIDWIRYFVEQMERFHLRNKPCCDVYLSWCDDPLLLEYLHRLKSQVGQIFKNIGSQGADVVENADGRQMTSVPEDMFNAAHIQLGVARDGLPPDKLKDAVMACFQELTEVQRKTHDILSHEWKGWDPLRLCASANDNRRMQEKCIELAGIMISIVPQNEPGIRELLALQARAVADEYFSIAIKSISYLAQWIVLNELEEPVFSKLYSSHWEETGNLGSIVTATIADYMGDLKRWLNPLFLPTLLFELVVEITGSYVMSIRRHYLQSIAAAANPNNATSSTPSSSTSAASSGLRGYFGSSFQVNDLMLKDVEALLTFFVSWEQKLQEEEKARKKTEVIDADFIQRPPATTPPLTDSIYFRELEYLKHLSEIVKASNIAAVTSEVHLLCERYGLDGLRAVQCAIYCNTVITGKQERQELIDQANMAYMKGMLFEIGTPVRSQTVASLTVQHTGFQREFSDKYVYLGDSTNELPAVLGSAAMAMFNDMSTGHHAKKSTKYW